MSIVLFVYLLFFFFFFKQKPAYELRISDWSSDVCSSDLAPLGGPVAPHAGRREVLDDPGAASCREAEAREDAARDRRGWAIGELHEDAVVGQRADRLADDAQADPGIGRAASRERVC